MPQASAWARVASDVGTRDDVEAGANALAEQIDEMLGGRAGAEAEPHARRDEFDGARGGGAFLGIGVQWALVDKS